MRQAPTFETTTRLVARALGADGATLAANLRRAHAGDLAQVLELRRRNLELRFAGIDSEYLQWRYRFGRTDRGLGDLWVLYMGERLLGIVGTEDLVVRHADRRWNGIRTMDILVERSLHNSGLGVWLNQALFRTADFTLAVGANAQSAGLVTRLFRPLPMLQVWKQPIGVGHFLRRRYLGHGRIAGMAIAAANLALLGRRRMGALAAGKGLEMRPITCFDAAASTLAGPGTGNRVAMERGADYLNYRLFDNPRARYNATGAWRAGKLVGYVAWRPVNGEGGDSWLHVIDWRTSEPDREDALPALLGSLAREAELASCSFVLLVQQSVDEQRLLARAGFIGPRPGSEKLVGLHAQDPHVREALSAASWSLTDLDDDNDGA